MTSSELELVYHDLAEALDSISPSQREIFLAKLVLLLAQDTGRADQVRNNIQSALLNLER